MPKVVDGNGGQRATGIGNFDPRRCRRKTVWPGPITDDRNCALRNRVRGELISVGLLSTNGDKQSTGLYFAAIVSDFHDFQIAMGHSSIRFDSAKQFCEPNRVTACAGHFFLCRAVAAFRHNPRLYSHLVVLRADAETSEASRAKRTRI